MRAADPTGETPGWLFTVGGGAEPGETTEQAARREAREEAGLTLPEDLGEIVLRRRTEFDHGGSHHVQDEDYWMTFVRSPEVTTVGWTDEERRDIEDLRWWSLDELARTRLRVFPEELVALVESALGDDGRGGV